MPEPAADREEKVEEEREEGKEEKVEEEREEGKEEKVKKDIVIFLSEEEAAVPSKVTMY